MIKEIKKLVKKPVTAFKDVELTMYTTEDGKEFDSLSAAQKHERESQIKRVEYDVDFVHWGEWMLLRNADDLYYVLRDETKERFEKKIRRLEYPVWILLEYDCGEQNIYTQQEIRDQLEAMLNKIPSCTK